MGSSSAFTAGLFNSLMGLDGRYISKEELSRKTIFIEQELIHEHVGSQDQTFAAYGGFNVIDFLQNGEISVQPIIISPKRLALFESSLMLFYTGTSRIASDIAKEQIGNTDSNLEKLHKMKQLVKEACHSHFF